MTDYNQEYVQSCLEFVTLLQKESTKEEVVFYFERLLYIEDFPQPMLLYVKNIYRLDSFSYFVVLYAFLYELSTEVISYIHEVSKLPYLSLGVLLSIYSKLYEITPLTLSEGMQLLQNRTLFCSADNDYALAWKVKLRKNVLYCLNTGCLYEDNILMMQVLGDNIAQVLEKQRQDLFIAMQVSYICVICGEKGTGKRTLVLRIAKELNVPVYVLSLTPFLHHTKEQQEDIIEDIIFYCRMQEGMLYIEDVKEQYEEELQYLLTMLQKEPLHIILSSSMPLANYPVNIRLSGNLEYDDMCTMSRKLWYKDWPYPCIHLKLEELIHLKEIDDEGRYLMDYITSARAVGLDSKFYHLLNTADRLQDWKGEEALKRQLQQIIYLFQNRDLFPDSNSMKHACTVLFHGPSGTGKTFAAGIIGNETNLPVWQIDLSMVMDKYVGESEKHLHEVFEKAQQTNTILLFDEADVLFGKRTGISTANDRYANSSTAFLLQELERYHGCVILTSNVLSNFDDAFLRRISFIIRFPLPDVKAKTEKWKVCFRDIPCECELPYEVFAEQLALTQAQIQSIAQNAVLYWKLDATEYMNVQHVLQAIQQEYQKRQEHMPMLAMERQ